MAARCVRPLAVLALGGLGAEGARVKRSNAKAAKRTFQADEQQRDVQASLGQLGTGNREDLPLIKELFTFGAPGSGDYAAWNELRTGPGGSECFPGLRVYKEGWNNDIKYHDFAAGLCCNLLHAKQNVLVLGPNGSPNPTYWSGDSAYNGDSMYAACDGGDDGRVGWPNPWGGMSSWGFHNWYAGTLRQNTLDHWGDKWHWENGQRDRDQFIRAFAPAEIASGVMLNVHTNGMTDADVQNIRSKIDDWVNSKSFEPVHPAKFNLRLVGALEHNTHVIGFPDKDLVFLVQQHGDGAPGGLQDNDCILSFEGTDKDAPSEFAVSLNMSSTRFCGHWRHGGFVNELRQIMGDWRWKPQIQDKLSLCRSVTVTGFSMGGSVAEVFAFCAHRHSARDTEDFKQLSWASGPSNKTGQRLPEITRGDGDGQGVPR